jgi:hypothetical protein
MHFIRVHSRLFAAQCFCLVAAYAADPVYNSARKKLDLIEAGKVPRGSVVNFPVSEINAWARVRVPEIIPEGIRDIHLELGTNTATGTATVNFLKMRQAQGLTTRWFLTKVIEGERPLKVSIRLESSGGRCTVFLTRVELSNVSATKSVLDFLLKSFFLPLYPDAHINEPFDLDYNMERIELRPGLARVVLKK